MYSNIPESVTLARGTEGNVYVFASMPASLASMKNLNKYLEDTEQSLGKLFRNELELRYNSDLGECFILLHNVNVHATRDTANRMFYVQSLIYEATRSMSGSETNHKVPVDITAIGRMLDRTKKMH